MTAVSTDSPGYEVVYRWPDGREEVRHRRPHSDPSLARIY